MNTIKVRIPPKLNQRLQLCSYCKGIILSPYESRNSHNFLLTYYGCTCGGNGYYTPSGITSDSSGKDRIDISNDNNYAFTKYDQEH